MILHNCLLDYGASHNVMPKLVMERLSLDITNPYHDLYSFDSKRVTCFGLIKDLVVNLNQLPMKIVVMDVVVADGCPKYGMFLFKPWSRNWEELCTWICLMPLSQYLEGNIEGYIGRFSWIYN